MKQILQDMSNGESYLVTSPSPRVTTGHLIIDSTISLISAGTERMLVDFGKANLLDKALQQPEKVKMVLDKAKTDGISATLDAVRSKLAQPLPLGYSNVGIISSIGKGVHGYKKGDRIVSNGAHADVVRVPQNLCAKIPDNVSDEEASFTVVASIGLQGIRLAKPSLGEAFVVTGVGLIGLLVVQLLRAHGCRVLAIDFDQSKLDIAKSFGAEICNPANGEDPIHAGIAFSRNNGVDGVIVTASTKSSAPVSQAARMCRKRGRIVLVGVTGLELNRSDFYEKELSFQVSCSYGPGRYDSKYEQEGIDYPFGFVRWTEQRNFEAILDMMSCGKLTIEPLISKLFDFENAEKAYEYLTVDKSVLGILLEYKGNNKELHQSVVELNNVEFNSQVPIVGFIGAGNYASRILIPAFKKAGSQLHTISTSSGVSSIIHGEKAGFAKATTVTEELLNDGEINTVVIVTRHNSHAQFVTDAIDAGKNVFVEKPLALNTKELSMVEASYSKNLKTESPVKLMVGFNRRFAPQIQKIKELLLTTKEPKSFIMTMNAGAIPLEHWTQDKDIGGGRIIGEACHYIDLMRHLIGHSITSVQCQNIVDSEDNVTILLGFSDGSMGSINYFANGPASFPKERIEVFCAGRTLQLDNFRKLKAFGWPNFNKMNLWQQDKGQEACVEAFLDSIKNGEASPIPADELFEVARVSIDIVEQLRNPS